MEFDLTSDQLVIKKAVRELCGKFPDEYWRKMDEEHEFPWDFYNAFAEGGWLGMAIPEQYGGAGMGVTEAALLLEEVAASGAAMNGCSPLHPTIFGINTVTKHGSDEMREEVLPQAANGSLHVCFGLTEPDAGTDTSRISTFAKKDGSGYVISGRKVWITKAAQSTKMVLACRTTRREEVSKSTDGISLFLIDIDPEKVQLQAIPKMGRNAVQSYQVFIDELRVPESARVGEEGKGFRYLLDGLNPERVLLAHESLGIGTAALEKATTYANERVVFDRPIGQNQGIAFPLAEAHMRLEAARLMARKAAWLYDRGQKCGAEANMAKYLCADAAFFAADRAMQTHGGMGYAREYDVERYFREARLMRLAPVSQEMVLNYLSMHALGLPKSY
ncbi:acyl-CoA dehydrogenase [Gordonia sp. HNM0687]|uniref:Acyl-CoA dehydrogenase n=1 Tax=Gordonia mangrovi TaxID=2665643 RepID=A0A6L7GTQ7_9ACTN|nr:acyl-CoA dehydrogenase family protein [Gordonia mangrovi]MXP23399.1 acyl-CoA dehydrogenase [Gordonia mangrovi]UVF76698.1 acyl-CoA/acyl-ACP dehydrogenase [Gordonia mangrovi]